MRQNSLMTTMTKIPMSNQTKSGWTTCSNVTVKYKRVQVEETICRTTLTSLAISKMGLWM